MNIKGTATIECEGYTTKRKDFIADITLPKGFQWRGAVVINGRMYWQWCETEKQAEDWIKKNLPKNFIEISA